jgi:hypothetical protein
MVPENLTSFLLANPSLLRFGDVNTATLGPGSCPVCGNSVQPGNLHICYPAIATQTYGWAGSTVSVSPYLSGTTYAFRSPSTLAVEKREMPVIGYRQWTLTTDWEPEVGRPRIGSIGMATVWEPGVNTATCTFSDNCQLTGLAVPDPMCQCGFYAWSSLHPDAEDANDSVIGAVLAWGRVLHHGSSFALAEGFRAQYVRVLAFLKPKAAGTEDEIAKYANEYGVPVLTRTAMGQYVREFGDHLPDD